MEVARVHRWAVLVFIAVYVLTLLLRWVRAQFPLSYHLGPAIIGAAGVFLMFESSYLIFHALYYHNLKDIQGLTIYAIAGALSLFTAGLAGVIQGLKE